MSEFQALFPALPALIGVVHLPPLPGSPFDRGQELEEIEAFCIEEVREFERGGFHGVLLENAGDGPRPKQTPPETVAALAALAFSARKAVSIPIGLSGGYDAVSTIGAAVGAGASFVRAPIFLEASVTPAGIVEGMAATLLRYRKSLGRRCAILADVHVKNTVPLSPRPLIEAFRSATANSGADAIVVTGVATGAAPSPEEIAPLWAAARSPLLIGSGVTPQNAAAFAACSHGFIIGTYCKDPRSERVSSDRVRQLAAAAHRRSS